jgi:hypothetical protein
MMGLATMWGVERVNDALLGRVPRPATVLALLSTAMVALMAATAAAETGDLVAPVSGKVIDGDGPRTDLRVELDVELHGDSGPHRLGVAVTALVAFFLLKGKQKK